MEDLRIETTDGGNGIQELKLTGPFTIGTMFDFQNLVREHKAANTIIDLSGVPYMDSAALGCLLGFHVSCAREGRKYALVGASDRLKTLFKVAGVNSILLAYDSAEAAKKAGVGA
jgi:anti-anti-sigma factor